VGEHTRAGLEGKGKVTRREKFLAEMNAVIPWPRLMKVKEPHYPKKGRGRQPPPSLIMSSYLNS